MSILNLAARAIACTACAYATSGAVHYLDVEDPWRMKYDEVVASGLLQPPPETVNPGYSACTNLRRLEEINHVLLAGDTAAVHDLPHLPRAIQEKTLDDNSLAAHVHALRKRLLCTETMDNWTPLGTEMDVGEVPYRYLRVWFRFHTGITDFKWVHYEAVTRTPTPEAITPGYLSCFSLPHLKEIVEHRDQGDALQEATLTFKRLTEHSCSRVDENWVLSRVEGNDGPSPLRRSVKALFVVEPYGVKLTKWLPREAVAPDAPKPPPIPYRRGITRAGYLGCEEEDYLRRVQQALLDNDLDLSNQLMEFYEKAKLCVTLTDGMEAAIVMDNAEPHPFRHALTLVKVPDGEVIPVYTDYAAVDQGEP